MRTLHLVSHTHWDREWYLTFQQFRLKLVRLVDGLLDILATDEQYKHFMLDGQTIVLEDYLAVRPEKEAELRRYIQQGRVLIGPWYILPDEFLVSPEATIRNLLEGDRITRRFGAKMPVGYIPDPFGHIGQMPQILRGFGINSASVMRGLADEPCELWWEAPDGSRVLMAYLRNGYGAAAGILNGLGLAEEASLLRDSLAPFCAAPHILLMHGTDHMKPQVQTSQAIAKVKGQLAGDVLIHSTLPQYLDALRASVNLDEIPVVRGELRSPKRSPLLPGVLSTRMWIKQRNRACETLLEKWAEPFSSWAAWSVPEQVALEGLRHPSGALREAWRLLMQCHPHDSICGCSIDQVHEEMRPRFDQVEQIGEEISRQSLQALERCVETAGPNAPVGARSAVIVFNPGSGQVSGVVSAVLEGLSQEIAFDLVDEAGKVIPYQMLGLGSSELINMTMDRKAFRSSIGMVADGMVMGLRIREAKVRRKETQAFIEVILAEKGEPNQTAWDSGREQVQTLLRDPEVDTYTVIARSAETTRVIFSALQVPEYGYRTFWVRAKPLPQKQTITLNPWMRAMMPMMTWVSRLPFAQPLIERLASDGNSKPPYRIENEFLRVTAQADGTLDVLDRATGQVYRGQNRFVDGGDRGDTYNYSPPENDRLVTAQLRSVRVEQGQVQQQLLINLDLLTPEALAVDRRSRAARSVPMKITCRVVLTKGVSRVDVHTTVENRAKDHRLRVHFPASFAVTQAEYDGHFEIVNRPVGLPEWDEDWIEQPRPEAPQRAFTRVADEQNGLLIANRGLPEVEVRNTSEGYSDVALTLLRCVGWLSRDDFPERKGQAGPALATPEAQMLGSWTFDYAIVPHKAKERLSAFQQAYAFEAPMRAESAALHEGVLPSAGSFMQVEPGAFRLSSIKAVENGGGWVVRGYNLSDALITVRLNPMLPYQTAERVDLAEQPLGVLPRDEDGQSIRLVVHPHEIVTVLFHP